jgi:tetratricopeptide (TPR) repeat protein
MKRVLEKNPQNAKVWYEAASLAEELCEFDVAQDYLQRSLQLEPMNTLIYRKIGQVFFSLKRYSDSISILEQAIGLCNAELQANGNNLFPELSYMLSTLYG